MAADWIKWEKGLWRKPEVLRTARLLGVGIADACLLWMRLWEWADDITINGNIPSITAGDIDMVVGRDGFAKAAQDTGWLIVDAGGVTLPNYHRHNGDCAKRRALDAQRKKVARSSKR